MIKIENFCVLNMDNAIRGARNPMESHAMSDSHVDSSGKFVFGPNDLALATKLCRAGSDHRKFIRQIFVSADITAPLYWWKEFDTYKVGTVANSTSTMHKIHARPITADDFSMDHMIDAARTHMDSMISYIEQLRKEFVETKNKEIWYSIIQLLPSSYNQMRTCTVNYEVLTNMYFNRKDHKLEEWREFAEWIKSLPYAKELIGC
ncbi:MAG: hypothetical protein FWC20_01505 [Oscillospiraceae bacterium]|nr:hypothetical protein [Oscillospiraceae bacterium]MCL2278069.1 hypothetical protein [Oscillospiraceae bacterium]